MDKVNDTRAELEKLLALEFEQNTIKDLECLTKQTSDMQLLVEEAIGDMQQPPGILDRIKSSLGSHEDLNAQIEIATEQYNIAVCQQLAVGLARLPRELHDMVYQYLVPDEVSLCTILESPIGEPHIHYTDESGHERVVPYLPTSPRTKGDFLCSEHFWRNEALGVELIGELTEAFYRYPTFLVSGDVMDSDQPCFLLKSDRFGLGHHPKSLFSNIVWNHQLMAHGVESCVKAVEALLDLGVKT